MSRFEESKLMEHEGRLDEMSHELQSIMEEKSKKRKMTKFKVIAIEFKEDKYKRRRSSSKPESFLWVRNNKGFPDRIWRRDCHDQMGRPERY